MYRENLKYLQESNIKQEKKNLNLYKQLILQK